MICTDRARTPAWRLPRRRVWLALLFVVGLAGCATPADRLPDRQPARPVRIGPELFLTLPQPGELGRDVDAVQLVSAHYGDQIYGFQTRLSAAAGRFTFVAVDMLGRRAMTVTWTDEGVIAEKAPWLPAGLRPESMLADIVLIYWPEGTVRRSLSGGDLQSSTTGRAVFSGSQEVIRVDYQPAGSDPWNGRLQFRNIAWGYALDIRSTVTQ